MRRIAEDSGNVHLEMDYRGIAEQTRPKGAQEPFKGGKSPKLDRRTLTAFHEAGHALAHHILGLPYDTVSIVPDLDSSGRISYDTRKIYVNELSGPEADALIITKLAGMAAESTKSGITRWAQGSEDFNSAFSLAAKLFHLHVDDVEHYLRYLWVRANAMLNRPGHWLGIERTAAELLKVDHLRCMDVAQILKSSLEFEYDSWNWRLTTSPALANPEFALRIRSSLSCLNLCVTEVKFKFSVGTGEIQRPCP